MKKYFVNFAVMSLVILLSSSTSWATNGMNMIGFGAKMSSMGGVSLGMSGDLNQMYTNPASLTSLNGRSLSGGVGLLMPAVHFTNSLNDMDGDSKLFPLPSLGYANRLEGSSWAYGVGFYAQGGMGATFPEAEHSLFANYQDGQQPHALIPQEYHSQVAYLKLVPTVAYQVNDRLSTGIGIQIGTASLQMAMPFSMDPLAMQGDTGAGMTFGQMFSAPQNAGGLGYDEITAYADMKDGTTAYGFGFVFGLQYKVSDQLTLGMNYVSQSSLTFKGDASMDMTSQFGDAYEKMVMGAMQGGLTEAEAQAAVNTQLGGMGIDPTLGMKDSYDAEVEMGWPQQLGFGAGIKANDRLTLGIDVTWLNWKDAMDKFTMKFSGGTNANINTMMGTPDGELNLEMPLNWDDQIVFALGAEYLLNDAISLRGGFNYASNPVPEETLIPIFPAVVQSHITLGFGYRINDSLTMDVGYEFVPKTEVDVSQSLIANEYNGSMSSLAENVIHLTFNYQF